MNTRSFVKINFKDSELVMSRQFYKKASIVGSDEYNLLQRARGDYPNFAVSVKRIKKNSEKESYKGLTYNYMRAYINRFDENHLVAEEELDHMLFLAMCHTKRYPVIKRWFLDKYPEVKNYGLPEIEEEFDKQKEIENALSRDGDYKFAS